MMEKWIHSPPVLQQKTIFTMLLGVVILGIAAVMFFLSKDHILLSLGSCIFVCCMFRGIRFFCIIVREEYEVVSGICTGIRNIAFRRYRKVFLLDGKGNEITLLFGKQQPLKPGCSYRFYFQKSGSAHLGSEYLDAMFSADHFLGCEEIDEEI